MSTGKLIKETRNKSGMTQAELAEKIGVATITIRQYESDKREPRMKTLQAIADALGVRVARLIYLDFHDLPEDIADVRRSLQKLESITEATETSMIDLVHTANEVGSTIAHATIESLFSRPTAIVAKFTLALDKLNDEGQKEAVKRVEELSEIPKYQRSQTPPTELPAGQQGGADTVQGLGDSQTPPDDL